MDSLLPRATCGGRCYPYLGTGEVALASREHGRPGSAPPGIPSVLAHPKHDKYSFTFSERLPFPDTKFVDSYQVIHTKRGMFTIKNNNQDNREIWSTNKYEVGMSALSSDTVTNMDDTLLASHAPHMLELC